MPTKTYTIKVTDREMARVLRALEHVRSSNRCTMFEMRRMEKTSRAEHYENEVDADQAVWDTIVRDHFFQDTAEVMAIGDYERERSTDWRDSVDSQGIPTQGPALSSYGCHFCQGPLDAKSGTGQYECPWCIARFPERTD